MNYHNKYLVRFAVAFTLILILPFNGLIAQEQKEEVTIIAPFEPSVTDPVKLNPAPQVKEVKRESADYQFNVIDTLIDPKLTLAVIQPRQTSKDPMPEFTRNYIRVGFGSQLTPYLEFTTNTEKKNGFQLGTSINHISTFANIKDYAPSSTSHSDVALYGRWSNKKHFLGADIDYDRLMVHNYGFKPDSFPESSIDKDSLRQRYQTLGASFAMERNYSESDVYKYNFTAGFYHLDNVTETKENSLYFKSSWARIIDIDALDGKSQIAIEADLDHFNYADSLQSLKRNYVRVMPYFQLDGYPFRLIAGANMYFSNDSSDHFNIYPIVRGEFVILENQLRAYAGVRGKAHIQSYRSLTNKNPHLISTPDIRNTKDRFEIYGGITGNASAIDYFVELSSIWSKDFGLMTGDTSLLFQNEFEIIYDDAQVIKVSGGISYKKLKQVEISLKAIYRDISPENELKPWNERNSEISLSGKYFHKEKLQLGGTVTYLGPFYARSFSGTEITSMKVDGGIDLNLNSEYYLTEQISVFLNLYNILNNKYLQWYDYPVQGFQVMVGGSYSF